MQQTSQQESGFAFNEFCYYDGKQKFSNSLPRDFKYVVVLLVFCRLCVFEHVKIQVCIIISAQRKTFWYVCDLCVVFTGVRHRLVLTSIPLTRYIQQTQNKSGTKTTHTCKHKTNEQHNIIQSLAIDNLMNRKLNRCRPMATSNKIHNIAAFLWASCQR